MMIIGITGSIGTGKSFISSCFKRLGFPVFNADNYVHKLMRQHPYVIAEIQKHFPKAVEDQNVNRDILRSLVKGKAAELKKLEAILHPLVRDAEYRFIRKCRKLRTKLAIMDIPLLFETGADTLCDIVIVTRVDQKIQQNRVLRRGKMGKDFLEYIRKLQLEQQEKCKKADLVIDTSRSKAYNYRKVKEIAQKLAASST